MAEAGRDADTLRRTYPRWKWNASCQSISALTRSRSAQEPYRCLESRKIALELSYGEGSIYSDALQVKRSFDGLRKRSFEVDPVFRTHTQRRRSPGLRGAKKKERQSFSEEFKRDVVRRVVAGDHTLSHIARARQQMNTTAVNQLTARSERRHI